MRGKWAAKTTHICRGLRVIALSDFQSLFDWLYRCVILLDKPVLCVQQYWYTKPNWLSVNNNGHDQQDVTEWKPNVMKKSQKYNQCCPSGTIILEELDQWVNSQAKMRIHVFSVATVKGMERDQTSPSHRGLYYHLYVYWSSKWEVQQLSGSANNTNFSADYKSFWKTRWILSLMWRDISDFLKWKGTSSFEDGPIVVNMLKRSCRAPWARFPHAHQPQPLLPPLRQPGFQSVAVSTKDLNCMPLQLTALPLRNWDKTGREHLSRVSAIWKQNLDRLPSCSWFFNGVSFFRAGVTRSACSLSYSYNRKWITINMYVLRLCNKLYLGRFCSKNDT